MPIFTLVSRVSDRLLLTESMDSEEDHRQYDVYRKKAKKLLQRLGADEGTQVVQDEPLYFLYLIDHDVCLLTLCDKAYPKKLAYKYLEELRDEFLARHGTELQERRLRPFACQKFDTFIQKTKRLYQDTKSQRNLNKVSSDLKDISRILQRNIDDILERGTKIERVATMSDDLVAGSRRYELASKNLVWQAWLRQWAFVGFFAAFFLVVLLFWLWY